MQLHQVVVAASPGDAITNCALEIRQILQEFGSSEIFARYIDHRLATEILPLSTYQKRAPKSGSDDVILFHGTMGEPDVRNFLEQRRERIVLIHHNITPPEFFRQYDRGFADLLDQGWRDIQELKPKVSLSLADSAFNARQLEEVGFTDVHVSPLITDFTRLAKLNPDPRTLEHLEKHVSGPSILFVGQLLPHKRPDLLVRTYHVLNTYLCPDSFLLLVGWARSKSYRTALQALIEELNLWRAWIHESVSDEALAAFYRKADVFVTMSEHEGFCAPVLEAMAFELPVVARPFGALPETIGDAGLLLPQADDPVLAAESINLLFSDGAGRANLKKRGRERLKSFDLEMSRDIFRKHLVNFL